MKLHVNTLRKTVVNKMTDRILHIVGVIVLIEVVLALLPSIDRVVRVVEPGMILAVALSAILGGLAVGLAWAFSHS